MKTSWRLIELLKSRRGSSLSIESWPAVCQCIVLKRFTHNGKTFQPADRLKAVPPDVLELPASEARTLQAQGLISPHPAADRFKCTYRGAGETWVGWRPWKEWNVAITDWENRNLGEFDDCLIRISSIAPVGGTLICPGVSISAIDSPIYLPFAFLRLTGSGWFTEDDPLRRGLFCAYLDEFAPAASQPTRPEVAV